jgi:hypothetical protein
VEVAGAARAQCGLKAGGAPEELPGVAGSDDSCIPPAVTAAVSTGGVFEGGLPVVDTSVSIAPADSHAAEKRAFLEEFIAGDASTSGGRLADWLSRVVDQVRRAMPPACKCSRSAPLC